ncbi:ATP-binding protein [Kitasatospora sp. NBC_01287]|uniref:ATP-binding protein n=1 Tax=Kitasatospora sp. NBC_01287 TaxID=2903573 RepID=UPI0022539B02|nr:ATP-binding protein [Kitasatospora sp. NBC_01287]MCX4746648.1 ATP-binding protein [Kitasatospora sp. NBC_01287]
MSGFSAPDEFHVQAGDGAVAGARRWVAAVIRAWELPLSREAVADVQLCTSEIVTNALVHAGAECWVRTEWTGSHLKVSVRDRSLRLPCVLAPDFDKGSGRGLTLVDSVAHSWGWNPSDSGKAVHFLVAADSAPIRFDRADPEAAACTGAESAA